MSIKISFIHYRNYITCIRVKWAVAFEEFDMVYLFWLPFSFHHHCQSLSIYKRPTLAKIWGRAAAPPGPPVSTGQCCNYFLGFQDFLIYLAKYFWSSSNFPNLITQQSFVKEFNFKINRFNFFSFVKVKRDHND